jgi:DNA-directed RNA polymerase subunit M/transcription elongation factor TFIIS
MKLEWICDECGSVWITGDDNNKPLNISELIELECGNCGSEFELVMNRA